MRRTNDSPTINQVQAPPISVTCLVDNKTRRGSRLWGEHGVAFLVETGGKRLLFDTGQSGEVLLHNMDVLGIDPRLIDMLAISHAHYDHTGGLGALLAHTRPGRPLYAHPDLFRERFSRRQGISPKSIGLAWTRETLATMVALHLSAQAQEMLPGVWTSGEIAPRPEAEGRSAHHLVRAAAGWQPDPYNDDMSVVLETPGGLMLLCGCCHAGLLNTLMHVEHTFARPVVLIAGGTHLVSADAGYLEHVAGALVQRKNLRQLYLNHCSGQAAYQVLSQKLGADRVRPCPAGTQFSAEVYS